MAEKSSLRILISCAAATALDRHLEHMGALHRAGYINDANLEHWAEYAKERVAQILNAKGALRVEGRI